MTDGRGVDNVLDVDGPETLERSMVAVRVAGHFSVTGILPDGSRLDVRIPAGTRDGQTLRLRGKGEPGQGAAPPGDALVEVSVRPHPVFRREGDDIYFEKASRCARRSSMAGSKCRPQRGP